MPLSTLRRTSVDLVPRGQHQGFTEEAVRDRRNWVERKTQVKLTHISSFAIPCSNFAGKIENPIGVAHVPLGIAGPLRVKGEFACGTFYVPMAANEGALVRSYERGMVALTRSGGVSARVHVDRNQICPAFSFPDVHSACEFARSLPLHFEQIRLQAESTTRHGKLESIDCYPAGRQVMARFLYSTGDAHGMNMIVRATDRACKWIVQNTSATEYLIFSGLEAEKRASGLLFAGGKGKKVIAGASLPAAIVKNYLHVSPEQMCALWRRTVIGNMHAGALGYCGHFANGLTAIFIACGQDVANVVNSSIGITEFELTAAGDLFASVTLPSLTVATVGGGTGIGTGRECLGLLDCCGSSKSRKLAEIIAAALLAGELSMGAAIAGGEFVSAHEEYGRNRPE
jgi:hydroxymethylglutaryl-CoA reductase (NADPH)